MTTQLYPPPEPDAGCGRRLRLLLFPALLLFGCAPVPEYDSGDVAQAAQRGELDALYEELSAALVQLRPSSQRGVELEALRADVAWRLARPQLQRIDELLVAGAAAPLSLEQLRELDDRILQLGAWLPEPAAERALLAASLRRQSEDEILLLERQLQALNTHQRAERYLLAMQLAALAEEPRASQLRSTAEAEMSDLARAAQSALAAGWFDEAQFLIDELAYANPDYPGVGAMQDAVSLALFELAFWRALVDGLVDEAYRLFERFAEQPAFVAQREGFAQDALELAVYFDGFADELRRGGDWSGSYRAFRQAAFIREQLERAPADNSGVRRFVQDMVGSYRAALRRGRHGAAYAYLSVIEQLDPGHELLPDAVAAQRARVLALPEHGYRAGVDASYEPADSAAALERRAYAYVAGSGGDCAALRAAMEQAALAML